ncbi:MAG: hypothetical protein HYW48_03480 [Deltaproteobacteria bacterium]|nr:hypothetical protein [Deltaproteobacteria bacterium]
MEEPAAQFPPNHLLATCGFRITIRDRYVSSPHIFLRLSGCVGTSHRS